MIPTFFVVVAVALFWAYHTIRLLRENSRLNNENTKLKEQILDYKLDPRSNNVLGF